RIGSNRERRRRGEGGGIEPVVVGLAAREHRVRQSVGAPIGCREIVQRGIVGPRDQNRASTLEYRNSTELPTAKDGRGRSMIEKLLALPDREIVDIAKY